MIVNFIYSSIDFLFFLPTGVYALFIICFIVQISFYTFLHTSKIYPRSGKRKKESDVEKSVSVIIAAKNESENLKKFLPKVLEQECESFEVIVVDDNSHDETQKILSDLSEKYSHLKCLKIKESRGKKYALSQGIKEAKHDYLLFTDADCYPLSRFWIKEMSKAFGEETQMILGYGPYENNNKFAESFVAYDTYQIALQYFSASSVGINYMAVGRNMAYKKELWESVSGFDSHKDVMSGDDDLFVADAANYNNVSLCVNKRAFTYSVPKKTILKYIKQKSRHVSTSKYYSSFAKLYSSVEILSRSLLFVTFVTLLLTDLRIYAISFILFRGLYLYLIGKRTRKQFNVKIKFYYFILFDIFAPVFYLMVVIYNRFIYKSKTW